MTQAHWIILYVGIQILFSITIVGSVTAGIYWRWKYQDISRRMHLACRMIQNNGYAEDILSVLKEH
jgi:hypothetical protein